MNIIRKMNKNRKVIFLYIGLLLGVIIAGLAAYDDISTSMAHGWYNYFLIAINSIFVGLFPLAFFSLAYFGYYYLFGSIIFGYLALVIWQEVFGGRDLHGTVGLMGIFLSFLLGIVLEILALHVRLFLSASFPDKYKNQF